MKCGKPLEAAEAEYCRDCSRRQHAFVRGRALLSYRGPVKLSLYRMKYGNRREYARVYGQTMAHRLGPWICQCGIGLIIPVPLHPSRKRKRGYNQAELLAKLIAKPLSLPCEATLRKRWFVGKQSAQKNYAARQSNAKDAVLPKGSVDLTGKSVVLVDDIITTGATAAAAVKALREMGASRVYVLAATFTPRK